MTDAAFCERVVRRHARTFALASRLLPREKRRGAYAVYAFCRTADDIVDSPHDPANRAAAATTLEAYRLAMWQAMRRLAPDPVLRELAWAVERFTIPQSALDTLLDGVAADLEASHYHTWAELQRYCQGVASSVGEMCAAVFGFSNSARDVERALAHARTLGVAMQLTNILRDIGEDARAGRCYLPEEDLHRFGLCRRDVISGTAVRAATWPALVAFEIARARELYRQAVPGIRLLAADAQRCALACATGYAGILAAIERNRYDTFSRRVSVSRLERAGILARAWLKRFPDLTPRHAAPNGAPQAANA